MDIYSKIHQQKAGDILKETASINEQTKRLEEIRKRLERDFK